MDAEVVVDLVGDDRELEVVEKGDVPLLPASHVALPAACKPGGHGPRFGPPLLCLGQKIMPQPPLAGTQSAAGPGEQLGGVCAPDGALHEEHMPTQPLPSPPPPAAAIASALPAGMPLPRLPEAEPHGWAAAWGVGPSAGAPLLTHAQAGQWATDGPPGRQRRQVRQEQPFEAAGQGCAAERNGGRGHGRMARRWRARELREDSAGSSSSGNGAHSSHCSPRVPCVSTCPATSALKFTEMRRRVWPVSPQPRLCHALRVTPVVCCSTRQILTAWRAPFGRPTVARRLRRARGRLRHAAAIRPRVLPAPRLRTLRCRHAQQVMMWQPSVSAAADSSWLVCGQEDAPELLAQLQGAGLLPAIDLLEVDRVNPPEQVCSP